MKIKPVLVIWVDSHSGHGWSNVDYIRDRCKPLIIETLGYLVAETEGQIIVVQSKYSETQKDDIIQQGLGDICIPICSIIERYDLDIK